MHALDKAKLLTGSDAKTAQILGMSKSTFSSVRAGRRHLTPYQTARLAEIIGEPWHASALERMAELAASEEERRFWRGKSETLRQTVTRAVMVGFLIVGAVFPYPSGKGAVSTLSHNFDKDGLFIAHHISRCHTTGAAT